MTLAESAVGGLIALAIFLGLYFLPTIVAANRKVTNVGSIAVINTFLGWTLVGWVIALAMAVRTVPASSTGTGALTGDDAGTHVAQVEPETEPNTQAGLSGPTAELERLTEMHARGALSDEEFKAAKGRLLGI